MSFWSRDHVATPVAMTRSSIGPMVSQISGQTSLPALPNAAGCFSLPSMGR